MPGSAAGAHLYESLPASEAAEPNLPRATAADDAEEDDGTLQPALIQREAEECQPTAPASSDSGRYWLHSAAWLVLGALLASLGFAAWWSRWWKAADGQLPGPGPAPAPAPLPSSPASEASRTPFRSLHSSYSCLPARAIDALHCRIGDQPPFPYRFMTHRWPATTALVRAAAGSSGSRSTAAAGLLPGRDSFVPACPVFFRSAQEGGLGDQLRVVLSGVSYAAELGVRFVHSPLTGNEKHFESFLGLAEDEATADALPYLGGFKEHSLLRIQLESPGIYRGGPRDQLIAVLRARCPGYFPLSQAAADSDYMRLDNETVTIFLPRQTLVINTTATPYILVVGWQFFQRFCSPCLILQLKRKYCRTRWQHPLPPLLSYQAVFPQENDGAKPVLHVAVHYRAGDLAFKMFRGKRWTLERLVTVMEAVDALLNAESSRARYGYTEMEFSVFSQSPANGKVSWQDYFAPVMAAFVNRTRLHWHIDLKSEVTFDAMVRAPVLIRGGSGFTNAIAQFRYGVDLSNQVNPCYLGAELDSKASPRWGSERASYQVDYANASSTDRFVIVDPDSGGFDEMHFHTLFADYVDRFGLLPLQFDSEEQCDSVTVECVNKDDSNRQSQP